MSLPKIIGLSGKARSGKDTVAAALTKHGYQRIGMADQLKVVVGLLFGWGAEHTYGALKEEIDPFWGMSPRQVMQKFGTDAMRSTFGENFWCRAMERQLAGHGGNPIAQNARWVIPDIRFPNEADMVHRLGGQVWRLERLDGRPAVNEHVSETALDHYERFDLEIHAPTGVDNLQALAEFALTREIPPGQWDYPSESGLFGRILRRGDGLTTR